METHQLNLSVADRPRLSAGTRFHPGNDHEACWLDYSGRTVELNETAGEILLRCNGEHTITELINDLTAYYEGSSESDIASAVQDFLNYALRKGWVDLSADLG